MSREISKRSEKGCVLFRQRRSKQLLILLFVQLSNSSMKRRAWFVPQSSILPAVVVFWLSIGARLDEWSVSGRWK